MEISQLESGIKQYLPENTADIIAQWIFELKLRVVLYYERSTKLGDYRAPHGNKQATITIDKTLNKYSFLITMVHEIAHAKTHEKYGRVQPHGVEWKATFQNLMLNFFIRKVFPRDLESVLAHHMKNPKAGSLSDPKLAKILMKYDDNQEVESQILLEDLPENTKFALENGRAFIKGEKRRTRYVCTEIKTKRRFLVSAIASVIPLN